MEILLKTCLEIKTFIENGGSMMVTSDLHFPIL